MDDVGMSTLDGDVANTYRLLTADDVSTAVRTQATPPSNATGSTSRPSRAISSPTEPIHTYLTKQRGVERPSEHIVARVEKRLRSLHGAGPITFGTFACPSSPSRL